MALVEMSEPTTHSTKTKSGKQYYCELCGEVMNIVFEGKLYDVYTGKVKAIRVEAACKKYTPYFNLSVSHTRRSFEEPCETPDS